MLEKGSGYIRIDCKPYLCSAPAFLCLNEKQTVETIRSEGLSVYVAAFLPDFINVNMKIENIRSKRYKDLANVHDLLLLRPFLSRDFSHSFITGLTPDMVQDTRDCWRFVMPAASKPIDWYWACRTRSAFLDCLHLMERLYYARRDDAGKTGFDRPIPEGKEHVAEAIHYIWAHYKDPELTATHVIHMCQCNRNKLNQDFREVTGQSVYQYILEYRLYAAERKLRFTDLSVEEIAYATGFSSASRFSVCFKDKTGLAPRDFRLQVVEKRRQEIQSMPGNG